MMIKHQIWWAPYFRAPASLVKYRERRGGYPPIPTTVLTHSVTQWLVVPGEGKSR